MYEKVNPSHPDKVADRIAGALVDLAYKQQDNPRIAVEVLIGHGVCHIITETSVPLSRSDVYSAVVRIAGNMMVDYHEVPQDIHLSKNQSQGIRCGDNGIFRGMPLTKEQLELSNVVRALYDDFPYDGKFILADGTITACQSQVCKAMLANELTELGHPHSIVNPLGDWTGGTDVDTGATNRKLGSDMGDAVTGGGLHGKDLSKADVSVNIYAHIKANLEGSPVELHCAIGDETVDGKPYAEIVEIARDYVSKLGGFEKFAEWGLI